MSYNRILVTGGAGFIGSHLVDRLLKDPTCRVTVYDNLSSGWREFVAHHLKNKNFRLVVGDLLDKSSLREAIKGHDFVFHLAANPDIRKGNIETDLDLKQNLIATYNLLEAMRVEGIKKIAFSSTSAVFGEPEVVPTPETYGPCLPISLYGASKLACEGLISAYCHLFNMTAWIFRFANIVGGRATHGVIYDFIRKLRRNPRELEILGDGSQEKSYLDVKSCVDAMLFIISHASDQVNVFNIGNTDRITVRRIAEIVVEEFGLRDVKFKFTGGRRGWKGDVPFMMLSLEKLEKLGWKPTISSEEAVRAAVRKLLNANRRCRR